MTEIIKLKAKDVKSLRDKLLAVQNGKCAICGDDCHTPQLDHDHITGLIRGVLCRTCNSLESRSIRHRYAPRAHISWTNPIQFLTNIVKYWKMDQHPYIHPTFDTEKGKQKTVRRRKKKK